MNWYKIAKKEIFEIFNETPEEDQFGGKDKWTSVDSSFITDAAYYEPLGMFEIKMKNGKEYSFAGVPKKIYEDFMASSSKGSFFNRVIKERYVGKESR